MLNKPVENPVTFRSDLTVRYVNHMGDDLEIIEDARTSLRKVGKPGRSDDRTLSESQASRLTDFFQYRHSSTLRGCILKVEVEVPIFVQRQLRTHWVGFNQRWNDFAFNDQSGKYARYTPVFWMPRTMRMEEDFTPMTPTFRDATPDEEIPAFVALKGGYEMAWLHYQRLINLGVAREIARSVLPEGLYVSGRITGNLNAWFGLLSLRIDHPDNAVATYPQLEIQQVAEQVEELIKTHWPAAHAAWVASGRTRL